MDTDQLLTFERIVREGSFSRAARTLDLSQPTLSTRIQALEDEVGGALLVRHGRAVTLTERGESFLPYVRRALTVLNEGIEVSRLTQEGKRGRITLGTLESLTSGFLTKTLAQVYARYPEVEVFIRSGHSQQIEQMLYDGVVRLGLVTWPFVNPDLTPLLRIREPLVFVAPPGHPLTHLPRVTAEDIHLLARPLLLPHAGAELTTALARIDPHPERVMEVPVQTARELLAQGIGAAFLTRTTAAEDIAAGTVVELAIDDIPAGYREIALIRLTRVPTLSAATQNFITLLSQQITDMLVPI